MSVDFDWSDYAVFALMLAASTAIGVYFGCFGQGQKSPQEYLLGGKQMRPVPVAMSLIASAISGITLIGVPSEVYSNGAIYWLVVPSLFVVCALFSYLFLPIFYDLQLSCAYEYLELRFHRSVRSLTSIFYCIANILFLPSIIYGPSLSLSLVTGINMHIISFVTTLVCVFYTMIGGYRTVVWTDFLQTIVTLLACVAIITIGSVDTGLSYIFRMAYDDGKIDVFNMDPNPFQRNTFWTVTLGTIISWTCGLASGQGSIQRFMSLPSKRDGQLALIIYCIGTGILTTLCIYCGLLVYAAYYGCDPIEQGILSQNDQIFPYYIVDKIGYVPALPGLFMAGVFGAALSTLSTGLNTITGTIYEDYIKRKNLTDFKAGMVMKFIVVAIGMFSVIMVVAIERTGSILSVTYIITSITSTPVSVVFVLGMLIPMVNTKGALAGSLTSMAFLGWVAIGSALTGFQVDFKGVYPDGIDTCNHADSSVFAGGLSDLNITEIFTKKNETTFFLYRLSYMFYFPLGLIIGVIVGVIVSYATGSTDSTTLDPNLISPPLRRFLPKNTARSWENHTEKIVLKPIE